MFKAKLRRIGNSQGVYIPKDVITSYKIGDVITLEVISANVITNKPQDVVKPKNVITPAGKKETKSKKWVFNINKGINELKG